jgi:hypothetical protein
LDEISRKVQTAISPPPERPWTGQESCETMEFERRCEMTWLFIAAVVGAIVLLTMAAFADVEERHRRNDGAPKAV